MFLKNLFSKKVGKEEKNKNSRQWEINPIIGSAQMVNVRDEMCLFLPPALEMKASLIFEEIFMNIAWHAYKGNDGNRKPTKIIVEYLEGIARLTFIDEGMEFDMTKFDITADEKSIGGHGIQMIRELASSIHYERKDGNNILIVEFTE